MLYACIFFPILITELGQAMVVKFECKLIHYLGQAFKSILVQVLLTLEILLSLGMKSLLSPKWSVNLYMRRGRDLISFDRSALTMASQLGCHFELL